MQPNEHGLRVSGVFRSSTVVLAAAAIMLLGGWPPATSWAATKPCGTPGGPACPPPVPVISPWAYMVEVGYTYPPKFWFDNIPAAEGYMPSLFVFPGNWCSETLSGLTYDDDANWLAPGQSPLYYLGIDVEHDDTIHYDVTAWSPPNNTPPYCAVNWTARAGLLAQRTVACPAGLALTYSTNPVVGPYCGAQNVPPPQKAQGCSGCSSSDSGSGSAANPGNQITIKGDPADVSNANQYLVQSDYVGAGTNPLRFARSYNSSQGYLAANGNAAQFGPAPLGVGWTATYFQRLLPATITDNTGVHTTLWALRPDGRVLPFTLYMGAYVPDADIGDVLVAISGGYQYRTSSDTIETYSSDGLLLSIAVRGQAPILLTYNAGATAPSAATDAFGHSLSFGYQVSSAGLRKLATVTDAAGHQITYGYDASGNLASVTYPDTTARIYGYSASSQLISLTDESNAPYATWGYTGGQITSFSNAGGVNSYAYTYLHNGTTNVVVDPLGTSRSYGQQLIQGMYRMTSASSVCPGCGEDMARGYGFNGNIVWRIDFDGHMTQYVYDTDRNLELSRTEALTSAAAATANSRTITTSWHATWRQPLLISVYAGATAAGSPLRTTAFTYDAMGNVLTRTVTDPATSTSRVWTYTYDAYGRVLTADGPRTDLVDKTTYAYYTCTTGYQCGHVQSITNALNQAMNYNSYNAHGQPLTITGFDGISTTLSYDVRQRLTAMQIGTEATGFDYWPTGLLRRTTLPDGSYVQYTYDAARRLTQINDGPGNKIGSS